MNKWLVFLFTLFPPLAMADSSSLSFGPPTGDYSVAFLEDIFGVVDGLLHGTGSQIMGKMFSVFNAAVLALGGVVIMYTLLVSTMNTAHEGQMLGQKWSSVWVPIRSTIGLTLLIPKASGYCLMQIFVMSIVLQGIGAADKVWNVALDYLNQGGAIVQRQQNPIQYLTQGALGDLPKGAQTMLAGQVCMYALETLLRDKLQNEIVKKRAGGGYCFNITPSSPLYPFCQDPEVPDFLETINFVDAQTKQSAGVSPPPSTFEIKMPNIPQGSPYEPLNGLCGVLRWNALNISQTAQSVLTPSEIPTMQMSRAIALQQLYLDLAAVARLMVSNDPQLFTQSVPPNSPNYSAVAVQPYGIPQTTLGGPCPAMYSQSCPIWASLGGAYSLFAGTEYRGALMDYNAIMLPMLTLENEASNDQDFANERKFISDAEQQGWIMAGSYFFDLVKLNTSATQVTMHGSDLIDAATGLNQSTLSLGMLTFSGNTCNSALPSYIPCIILENDSQALSNIESLIDGKGVIQPWVSPVPTLDNNTVVFSDQRSSTSYGYTNNSMLLTLPQQPGFQPPSFVQPSPKWLKSTAYQISQIRQTCLLTNCNTYAWPYDNICKFMCDGISTAIEAIVNTIIDVLNDLITDVYNNLNTVLNWTLYLPIKGILAIFQFGMTFITTPGINPIVGLAQMGTYYINFASMLWLTLIPLSMLVVLIPVIGPILGVMFAVVMPLLAAWLGVMLSIGFTTAYYVPILPYMLFVFGAIAWLMVVIEAMVAAPLVALGITHPEGHEAFGRAEPAIMILLNVFLRPTLMIFGYIAGISLSYVGVWVLNAGFQTATSFMNPGTIAMMPWIANNFIHNTAAVSGGYNSWAGIYGYFFAMMIYIVMYMTVVQKAFTLIGALPDKVLRWIGGHPEQAGQEAAQWAGEAQQKIAEGTKATESAMTASSKQVGAKIGEKAASKFKGSEGSKEPESDIKS